MYWTYTKITPNRRYKCIERFTRRLCSISRLFRSFFEQFIYDFPSPREKRQTCGETSRHLGHGQTTTCSVPFESCVCHLGRTQKKTTQIHTRAHIHSWDVWFLFGHHTTTSTQSILLGGTSNHFTYKHTISNNICV